MGKLVGSHYLPDEFSRVIDLVHRGASFQDAEVKVFGFSHDKVGRDLLSRWRLPEVLSLAVGGHHQPTRDSDHFREAAVVHMADILCIADAHLPAACVALMGASK